MGDLEVVLGGDDTIRRNFSKLEELYARVAALEAPAFVTALPAASESFDGQVIYYDTGTEGVVWQLRYNADSASTYKWEFIGGADLFDEVIADEALAAGAATYLDLGTVGPDVTLPLAGDYDYHFGVNLYQGGAAVQHLSAGLSIAGATPVGPDLVSHTSAGVSHQASLEMSRRLTGRSASDVLKVMYGRNAAVAVNFRWRWLRVRPARVG